MELNKRIIDLGMSPADNEQIIKACDLIVEYLAESVMAIHLYGSALDGGLKPYSDLDLFVTVRTPVDNAARKRLMHDLLYCSAMPGTSANLRALEVTVVNYKDIVPWRYPARRELQFGEWLRSDILNNVFEPPMVDIDLTILLRKLALSSIPIVGKPVVDLFDPIPDHDFKYALYNTLSLWCCESDWLGDERNIILTIARIWYSVSTGNIASKEDAANWLLNKIPDVYQSLIVEAKYSYLGEQESVFMPDAQLTGQFINFATKAIASIIHTSYGAEVKEL